MRHTAWLHATPYADTEKGSQKIEKSRIELLKEKGIAPSMPPLEWGEYLIGYLFEVGPVLSGGMAAGKVTHTELLNYQINMGLELSPWECGIITRLSGEYAGESHAATKKESKPPFAQSTDARRLAQDDIDQKMNTFLS